MQRSAQQRRFEALRRRSDVKRRRTEEEQRLDNAQQRRRRLVAAIATLAVFGAIAAVTQISSASTRRRQPSAAACATPSQPVNPAPTNSGAPASSAGASPSGGASPTVNPSGYPLSNENIAAQNHTDVNMVGDGQIATDRRPWRRTPNCPAPTPTSSASNGAPGPLVLGPKDCSESKLNAHTGFQVAPACIGIAFGEVPSQSDSPSLIISRAPHFARANQPFTWTVITDNLDRSEFPPAAQGGYYAQASRLNQNGVVLGHTHNGCYTLPSAGQPANGSERALFFIATEDNQGADGAPSSYTVTVPGLPAGQYRCMSWAGTASHGVPMNQFANQQIAADVFRITVR